MGANIDLMLYQEKKKSAPFALVMSIFLPGFAWMYCGKIGFGICYLLGTIIGYLLSLPGILLHGFAIYYSWKMVKVYNEKLIQELAKLNE